ncbi:hypothetical protein [uncultured Corynebacterium sp.]|uniref:hypothetical protein n=1 Tax=uncultured Corynebacterium sp. TaxID=159447 RepID=UPI002595A698|nr:hypothetical protein [uncultured Corynebacterium sp.]
MTNKGFGENGSNGRKGSHDDGRGTDETRQWSGPAEDATRQIGRVPDNAGGNARNRRPQQYFPGAQQPQNETRQFDANADYQQNYQQNYQQPGGQYGQQQYGQQQYGQQQYAQQQYEPVPSDYDPDQRGRGKKNGGMAGVFAAIAVVAILAAGALFFLWRNAASDADKPAPEPVTETTTTQVPTTVTETEDAGPGISERLRNLPKLQDELPEDIPTELPPEIQDRLEEGDDLDVERLLRDLFGNSGNQQQG